MTVSEPLTLVPFIALPYGPAQLNHVPNPEDTQCEMTFPVAGWDSWMEPHEYTPVVPGPTSQEPLTQPGECTTRAKLCAVKKPMLRNR